jgi:hypothetical protein
MSDSGSEYAPTDSEKQKRVESSSDREMDNRKQKKSKKGKGIQGKEQSESVRNSEDLVKDILKEWRAGQKKTQMEEEVLMLVHPIPQPLIH